MEASLIVFAVATFVIAFLSGIVPIFSGITGDKERMKQLTGVAAGVIIASAMLVVIPEGIELVMTDDHGADEALAGSVALVILEVDHGDITADEGIEEIEELIGGHDEHGHEDHGHDDHGHDDHGHESEASLSDSIGDVIAEVEDGDINASTGIEEIEELISEHGHSEESHDDHSIGILMGGAIMAGFLLMFILEGLGIGHGVHEEHHEHEQEHGHGHVHHAAAGGLLVFGLTLHAATDGLAIGAASATGDMSLTIAILLAVLIHKGPVAFSLGIFSMHEREERKDSIRDVAIFAASTPVLIIISALALQGLDTHYIGLAILFSAGTFLYVATVDTLPDIHNPDTGKKAMVNVLIGVALFTVILLIANAMDLGHAH